MNREANTDAGNQNHGACEEEAVALSDRIGIMKNGRLLAVGTAESLMKQVGCDDFEKAFVSIVKEAEV